MKDKSILGRVVVFGVVLVFVGLAVFGGANEANALEGSKVPGGESQEKEPAYKPGEIIVRFKKGVADVLEEQLSRGKAVGALRLSGSLETLNGKYKVKKVEPLIKNFKAGRARIENLLKKDVRLLTKREKHLVRRLRRAPKGAKAPDLGRIYKIELEAGQSASEAVAEYNKDPDVEYAGLNHIVSICSTEPNDPKYDDQWALPKIDANEAWDISTGSSDVIIAVVDTGVDYDHRDLDDNIWVNSGEIVGNGVDDDENGFVDDIYGYDFCTSGQERDSDPMDVLWHGTHCAGIAAAEGNNGLDIAGVSWNSKVMAVKFMNPSGYGEEADAADAIVYATDNGADVISCSFGGSVDLQAVEDAVDYAYSQGVIVVAAAGNESTNDHNYYPAGYENLIAVAATNLYDQKASWSNYGDRVELVAPGTGILSLQWNGTVRSASGTSMACPHVSGACALLLAIDLNLTVDDVNEILMETVDVIFDPNDEICRSNGRLNLLKAARSVAGEIYFSRDSYTCSDEVSITLDDYSLKGQSTLQVDVNASGGDWETVTVSETDTAWIFTGTISTSDETVDTNDGELQVSHGETITVTYGDRSDTAMADCEAPVVSNIEVDTSLSSPIVTFETNEPATVSVVWDVNCGEPYAFEANDASFGSSHSIRLIGVDPNTKYYFIIEAIDAFDQNSVDSNDGNCYMFTTSVPVGDINVPGDFNTIQDAVDHAWEGDTVWVGEGTYTGQGNVDIEFRGIAITVRSTNPEDPCVVAGTVIDCNGSRNEPHRGFYLHLGEDSNSVISGFTITNGYGKKKYGYYAGGAIFCDGASPTISKCVITGNVMHTNYIDVDGGGIACFNGASPQIINCIIKNNAAYWAGGIDCSDGGTATISGCTISNNLSDSGGGILCFDDANATIINCTISENWASQNGGGMYNESADPHITNCIFWGNEAGVNGNEVFNFMDVDVNFSYCDIEGSGGSGNWGANFGNDDGGNIDTDPCFVKAGYWDANDDFWVEGDYHLLEGSPCIDAGDPNYAAGPNETDFDGNPRVFGGRVDMGAYEYQGAENTAPVACIVGGDEVVEAGSGCEASVTLDGSCSSDADSTVGTNDDINDFDWYEVIDACEPNSDIYIGSGEVIECNLGLGEHVIILEVTDKAGAFDSNEVVITVEDVTPPELRVVVEPNLLWPANGKMVQVRPEWEVSDNCDEEVEVSLVDISMSAAGDINDYVDVGDDGSIYLRARKSKGGSGRIYTLTYQAADDFGNVTQKSATVTVRHRKGPRRLGRGLVRRPGRQVYRRGVQRRGAKE